MMKKHLSAFMLLALFLGGCGTGTGQTTYYWYRPDTGVQWFSQDHANCMRESDNWPVTKPRLPGTPEKLNLRLKYKSDRGVWAYYVPKIGAQPVYINYKHGAWSVSPAAYSRCMRRLGYRHVAPPHKSMYVGIMDCPPGRRCHHPVARR
ncbi:MAG: hypothetical protein FWF01_03395 [Alphaproteobacteria bacterium]|nr:hypothetical protein [Alphaproteobacteria bacterium]